MKILHTADIHLGELTGPVMNGENARLMDTLNCLDYLVDQAQQVQPDVIVIAGDLFNKARLWADEMLREINMVVARLDTLSKVAPIVLLFGTAAHDNLQAFYNLDVMGIKNLHIVIFADGFNLTTKSGPLQVVAIPGTYDKQYFRQQDLTMTPEEENAKCSEALDQIIQDYSDALDPNLPSVLVAHYAVTGAQYSNEISVYDDREVSLPKSALAESKFDLVCLGHLHRFQEIKGCGRPVYYSGSINGIKFDEEGYPKGFLIHNIDSSDSDRANKEVTTQFIETPSRKFQTIKFNDNDINLYVNDALDYDLALINDKIIRVHYTCAPETAKLFDRKSLERELYAAGAFYVHEIVPKNKLAPIDKQELNESADPIYNLRAWATEKGCETEEIAPLAELAIPLLETVSARLPAGKLSGIFRPLKLEVFNYRSFRSEVFDFSQINFATVNGANGVGKSAFFMDAISDCLFEETREGNLDGWITVSPEQLHGKKITAGSITFDFAMGNSCFRVTRSRSKASGGKITLSLQEFNAESKIWTDRAKDLSVRDTQAKIIALLGMDVMTFRCCALIMQDAYGIFMEADKTERMEVLSNILGLNVYEMLADAAKRRGSDVGRELEAVKRELAGLAERLKDLPELKKEQGELVAEIAEKQGAVALKEADLKIEEERVTEARLLRQKAEDLDNKVVELGKEVEDKRIERNAKIARENEINLTVLDHESKILEGAREHEHVRDQVAAFKIKVPRLEELRSEVRQNQETVTQGIDKVAGLKDDIERVKVALSRKPALDAAVAEHQRLTADIEAMDKLQSEHDALTTDIQAVNTDYEKAKSEHNAKINKLKTELQNLESKVGMLNDSGCIDPEKAACNFLADAKDAATKIGSVRSELETTKRGCPRVTGLAEKLNDLLTERGKLGYQVLSHQEAKRRLSELQPSVQEAAQLEGKTELLKNLETQLSEAVKQEARNKVQLKKAEDSLKSLEAELAPLAPLEVKLFELQPWIATKEKLLAAREEVKQIKQSLKKLCQEIEAKEIQMEEAVKQRDAIINKFEVLKNAETNVAQLRNRIKALQDELNILHAHAGAVKSKLENLAQAQTKHDNLSRDIEPQTKLLTRYQTLTLAFGFDGIPFNIIRTVVPELSAMANEILGQMTGGKMSMEMKTELVQKTTGREVNALEVWVNDYVRGSMPYKSRSGGQKVKVALSVAFALADLKARRAGIQLGMLFVDEPPFLDGEGVDAYCDALGLLYEKYNGLDIKVLAVSHDPRMKARFPQQIEVEDLGEAGSKIRLDVA